MGLWKVERRFRRALVDLKGELRITARPGGEQAVACRTRNVSRQGALVSLDAPLKSGERVELRLEIPSGPIELSGRVVWGGEGREVGRAFGLELNAPEGPDGARFIQYLKTAAEQRRAARLRATGIQVHLAGVEQTGALDLSATGLLMSHTRPLRPGDLVPLRLESAGSTLSLQVRVIRSMVIGRQGETLRFQSGCAFLPPIPADLRRILDALARESAE